MSAASRESKNRLPVNLRVWLARIATWDGLLPAFIVTAPRIVEWWLPGRRGAIELVAIFLPVAAFLARMVAGRRHITSNHCGPFVRKWQGWVFAVAIVVLFFADAVLILTHIMPPNAFTVEEKIIGAILVYPVYLAAMAFAMYPGRERVAA